MSNTPLRYQHQREGQSSTKKEVLENVENFPGWVEDLVAMLQTDEKYTYVVQPQSAYCTTRVEGELFNKAQYATNKFNRKGATTASEEPAIPVLAPAPSADATEDEKAVYAEAKDRFKLESEMYKFSVAAETKKAARVKAEESAMGFIKLHLAKPLWHHIQRATTAGEYIDMLYDVWCIKGPLHAESKKTALQRVKFDGHHTFAQHCTCCEIDLCHV